MLLFSRFGSFFERKIRKQIVGLDTKVPTRLGSKTYINLDNAASTPALRPVLNKCEEFLKWYSSVHRGYGYKSMVSTAAYDDAHLSVLKHFGAEEDTNTVIFGKNTTEAINKLSYRLSLRPQDVILTTLMEHHSNDLPWRGKAQVVHVRVQSNGCLDVDDLETKLRHYESRVKLLAVTGASNVTGCINDIHDLAARAHQYGARILVDAAQLAPHRTVGMLPDDDESHIDFLAVSGHKMYAPFGTGALIGPRPVFKIGDPEYVGGGTVSLVTQNRVRWNGLPEREEAGSPNVVGAVALSEAINFLSKVGMGKIAEHETCLTERLLTGFEDMNDVTVYGMKCSEMKKRLGVITFNVGDLPHTFVASVLAWEGAVGVRNGCFCARPYIHALLGLSSRQIREAQKKIDAGDLSAVPGMVRISFGMYNTEHEVDTALSIIKELSSSPSQYMDDYIQQPDGSFIPKGMDPDYRKRFCVTCT